MACCALDALATGFPHWGQNFLYPVRTLPHELQVLSSCVFGGAASPHLGQKCIFSSSTFPHFVHEVVLFGSALAEWMVCQLGSSPFCSWRRIDCLSLFSFSRIVSRVCRSWIIPTWASLLFPEILAAFPRMELVLLRNDPKRARPITTHTINTRRIKRGWRKNIVSASFCSCSCLLAVPEVGYLAV